MPFDAGKIAGIGEIVGADGVMAAGGATCCARVFSGAFGVKRPEREMGAGLAEVGAEGAGELTLAGAAAAKGCAMPKGAGETGARGWGGGVGLAGGAPFMPNGDGAAALEAVPLAGVASGLGAKGLAGGVSEEAPPIENGDAAAKGRIGGDANGDAAALSDGGAAGAAI